MKEFNWSVRIYYEDTDAGGVVYHANYLKFFERARTEMLRSIGIEQDTLRNEQNCLFAIRSVQIDYLKPALFNELLEVSSKVIDYRKTNLTFAQTLVRQQQVLTEAVIRVACLDATTLKPTLIPFAILDYLSQ